MVRTDKVIKPPWHHNITGYCQLLGICQLDEAYIVQVW